MVEAIISEFDAATKKCQELFEKKMRDYDAAWAILRTTSLTDQIKIKSERIKSVTTIGTQKIADSIDDEFVGIINYCILHLVQTERDKLGLVRASEITITKDEALFQYKKYLAATRKRLEKTYLYYGDCWRGMNQHMLNNLILAKIRRIQDIENKKYLDPTGDELTRSLMDMLIFSVYALVVGKKVASDIYD